MTRSYSPIRLARVLGGWLCLCTVWTLLASAPASAQLNQGQSAAPFAGPGPIVPGLYAGIKDQSGVTVSWVRVSGMKYRGDLVPFLRGKWGHGLVDVPLVDIAMVEFIYTEGHIAADVHLLTGERMHLVLENPFTELHGWWRENPYSVPLAGVYRVWFRYVTQAETSSETYTGPPMNEAIQGVVTSVELHQGGGWLTVQETSGRALTMRFDYARLHSGLHLLLNKAPWLNGRTVRVLYHLSSPDDHRALREIRDIQLTR